MNNGKVRAALLLALVLAGTAGCASGGGSTATPSAPAPTATATASMPAESSSAMTSSPGTGSVMASAAAISIKDFAFGDPITVSPGATVMVTNMDTAEHTVTADQGSAFDVEVKGSGGTATLTAPSKPGTYAFHCTYHPNMHGTLTVK
ncbi:cupredoxin domain-containing protein [Pseudarthrobacter albicanus]|uniref:cupredoxin domain-containing protein n=1 Tax=Pseudarthrobacter albicanus TaxID=2823873 RepID=UPI001BA5CD39|nr:cupredoxin domain-containing protein [Pseudarthrobacter albicanus]